ncbi:chloramphenicol phosphotransferase CPT [Streptomyces sp. SID12488]|uniref:chloramphenicol phosphotransferase CPT n=1 Tax=Streptomyces sp. SID12488 TaxID=2706040 RepID=UPI001EF21151|nr:chloramphenicol phosphotransferase CPT [Streptomyces sp. SID12488]
MQAQMIILNGGSSSGKSAIVRCLQAELPDPWLAFGCDSFVDALPARMRESDAGIAIAADGEVSVGADFLALEAAWREGVVAMVRAGARVVIDDVFLGGAASQQRWRKALGEVGEVGDLPVLWVGVRCESAVAARREIARGDRAPGMAAAQADVVHEGVVYDLEVDTSHTESLACARTIAARVHGGEDRVG